MWVLVSRRVRFMWIQVNLSRSATVKESTRDIFFCVYLIVQWQRDQKNKTSIDVPTGWSTFSVHYWSVWQLKTRFISLYTDVLAYPVYGEWTREEMERENVMYIYRNSRLVRQKQTQKPNNKKEMRQKDLARRRSKKRSVVKRQARDYSKRQRSTQHAARGSRPASRGVRRE